MNSAKKLAGASRRSPPKLVNASEPLLSICIPTRNRSVRTFALVENLIPLVESYGGAVELIVSDNNSKDDTITRLGALKSELLHVHRQSDDHATAEAHVFSAAGLCRGAYIWFLGDDDIPVPETLGHAIELLKTRELDFLFFNSALIDEFSGLTGGSVARLNTDMLDLDFAGAAVAIGLMSGFAGLSNSIMRRERLSDAAWREIPKRSIIYAHVAWWLICFAGCRLTVINRPLVFYRVAEGSETFARFRTLAIELDWPDHHFWGEGLIDLLLLLEQRGILRPADIAAMFESRRDGSFGRALDDIAYAIFRQTVESIAPVGHRNRISGPTLDAITAWLERIDPCFHECVQVLQRIHALRPDPAVDPGRFEIAPARCNGADLTLGVLEDEFRRLHAHIAACNTPLVGLVSFAGPFRIFRHLIGYVAIREIMVLERQEVLRTIDPLPETGDIFVAADLPGIFEQLAKSVRTAPPKTLAPPPALATDPRLGAAVAERDAALAELNAIRNSKSWRATGPLRSFLSVLKSFQENASQRNP